MVVAGLLGALLTLSVLRAADNTQPVLVAAREIVPGAIVSARSVRVVRIHADAAVLASLFDGGAIDEMAGRVAVERVPVGSLVTRDAVRAIGDGSAPRAMSFPIAPAQAVAGSLVAGDRVDVLAVRHNSGRSSYVAANIEVLAFAGHRGSALQGSDDAIATLAVDSDAAARIASALETGSVTLVRATGARPLAPGISR